jgi:undecaprenyl-phosphate 4-deoxy-4-formamido-L-arabinose transferase
MWMRSSIHSGAQSALTGADPRARKPWLSVVIPVYNEEGSLAELHRRLQAVLEKLPETAETIFVDDGSTDGSVNILDEIGASDPRVSVVELAYNAGQHGAVLAGFQVARGEVIVTLDADLQNPPEEIPKLLAKIREGYEVVGGVRQGRRDPLHRRIFSALARVFSQRATDYGCMLRAYRADVVRRVLRCGERAVFIPALAATLARRVTEVPVAHEERRFGRSHYNPLRVMRLGFDLVTGSSVLPIQIVSVFGVLIAIAGLTFGVFLFARRLYVGPELEGVFTLFAILFMFVGALFVAVGVVGEYVARIYIEVRRRPRYTIASIRRGSDAP